MDTLYCKDLSRIEATILRHVVPPSKALWLPFKHIYNKCDHAPLHGVHEVYIDMTDPGNTCPQNLTVIVQLAAHMCPHQSWLHFIDLPSTPQYVCDTKCLYLKLVHTNRETGITYKYRSGHPIHSGMGTDRHGHGRPTKRVWIVPWLGT